MASPVQKDKTYKPVVVRLINQLQPKSLLDIGAGDGWLARELDSSPILDAIDWVRQPLVGYRSTYHADLNAGFPEGLHEYECIVSCENIAFLTNPGLFFSEVHAHLKNDGVFIISTPNTWHPQSRFQFFLRGFFPSFPSLAGKLKWGNYMHLIPWNFPQPYNFMKLHGFSDIVLHDVPEPRPKHFYEWIMAIPSILYCKSKLRRAKTEEEKNYWKYASSRQALLGRRLVISAKKITPEIC